MKHLIFLFLSLLIIVQVKAVNISESTKVSLLTVTSGDELYSTFGHSAIRICDSVQHMDLVFNYGTFDFNTPNFYVKFTRGKLLYMISLEDFNGFMQGSYYEGRQVTEQILNFTYEEKERLVDLLAINYRPENRSYKYDFIYDNCATRIRDIVQKASLNRITFLKPKPIPDSSFRQLMEPCLKDKQWCRLGIDIILGLPIDKKTDASTSMFLPYKMQEVFASSKLEDGRNLVSHTAILNPDVVLLNSPNLRFSPVLFGWLILIIAVLTLLSNKASFIFDYLFFGAVGLIGILVVFLWFFTDHTATMNNLNILWALPTHLVFIIFRKTDHKIVLFYFLGTAILSAILLLAWHWMPQGLNNALIPVVIALGVKSYFIYRS